MEKLNKLADTLEILYGDQADSIAKRLAAYIDKVEYHTAGTADKHWYKSVELYCIYPDGINYDASLKPLQNLKMHLKRIQNLGFNAIHILPFLESPMIDRGFDTSNFMKIRESLGSIEDMTALLEEANNLGIHVFMDLVFNHVSDQHEWFQKAIKGDAHYRNFFIHSKEKPKFIRKFHEKSAVWAEYEVDGERKIINIAFPEYAGPIPHWRDGGDGYWYYHTYYPDQIDLNWLNADVFIEMAKVVVHWAKLGFNFRLDAIPFIGKGPYKEISIKNKEAHAITAALICLADPVNPNCTFLVETYEELESVIEYFGRSDRISANLSYNFHLCTSIWVSLVTENVKFIWDKLEQLKDTPDHAEWLNFLRNHDELSLAYLSDDCLKMMQDALEKNGADFREGCGISGRTFSLLAENREKFLMAYFLLASLPGGMMVPYGDEIAAKNIPIDKLSKIEQKDTRNINRGTIDAKSYELSENIQILELMSKLLSQRKIFRLYLDNWPIRRPSPKEVFAACYSNGPDNLFIYINLSKTPMQVTFDETELISILQVNQVEVLGNTVNLGPYSGIWLKKSET
ncbi:MAG: alpha-amylase family protein [Gammaproteobacteria bacterium]|jgi:maltose alpha-D-glucosyltransferase/alpha-amylase|nr:alpha-amylase family protein [Gammaproteobacteria bacterium]